MLLRQRNEGFRKLLRCGKLVAFMAQLRSNREDYHEVLRMFELPARPSDSSQRLSASLGRPSACCASANMTVVAGKWVYRGNSTAWLRGCRQNLHLIAVNR